MYKDSKWAKLIIETQKDNGSFGYFHTLSEPRKFPITTEQALRRLEILGYTLDDEVIRKAVVYMEKCLVREIEIPDCKEKHRHWENFVDLMLATWICRFKKDSIAANTIQDKWRTIVTKTFSSGKYSKEDFASAYRDVFGFYDNKSIILSMSRFYNVSLLSNVLDEETEALFFDYVLNYENGIYYIYDKQISSLPIDFQSKTTSRYLGAIELLSEYKRNKHKLQFVVEWLKRNEIETSRWDMGSKIKDGFYMPLSDDWRRKENRITDCTFRIQNLISKIMK